jgi:hypothetical protein
MKRSTWIVAGLALALAAPSVASAEKLSWGGIRAWVKKSIADVLGQIKDPKVKEALDSVRKEVNSLKGKLQGLYPQFRALTGYMAVAAAKVGAGGKLKPEDVEAFAAKVKEALGKGGKEGLKIVRAWLQENKEKFTAAGKVFKVAIKKAMKDFRGKLLGWWKKMKKEFKKGMEEGMKEGEKKDAAK